MAEHQTSPEPAEVAEFRAAAARWSDRVLRSRETARAVLRDMGILDKDGQLTEAFR